MPRCRPASVCPHVSARLSSRRSPSAFLYVYLALRLAPLSRRCVSACVPVRLLLRLSSLVCVFAVCLPLPGCRVCLPVFRPVCLPVRLPYRLSAYVLILSSPLILCPYAAPLILCPYTAAVVYVPGAAVF